MSLLPILRYPDPRLPQVAAPVTVFDDALRQPSDDLLQTMQAAQGIGITPQAVVEAARRLLAETR